MRRLLSVLSILFATYLSGQQHEIDSLSKRLNEHIKTDSLRVRLMNELAYIYRSSNPDSSLAIATRALELAKELDLSYEEAWALNGISSAHWMKADYPSVLRAAHASLEIFQQLQDNDGIAQSYNTLANTYNMQGEHEQSLTYYKKSIEIYQKLNDSFNIGRANANIGRTYYMIEKYPEALEYLQLVIEEYESQPENILYPIALNTIGDVHQAQNKLDEALAFYMKALRITEALDIPRIITYSTRGISEIYQTQGKLSLSTQYAIRTLKLSADIGYLENVKNAALIISNNNKRQGNFKKAYEYYTQYTAAKDSMFNKSKEQEITKLKENFEIAQQQKEIQLLQAETALQKENSKNQRTLIYSIILITILVMVLGIVQYRKSLLKQRVNKRLSKLNSEIKNQKDHLEQTLVKLNETKDELEQALETRNKFFSLISHDLKGFASQFSGSSYLLGESLKAKDLKGLEKLVEIAQDSSQKMTRLLDNLLNWALQKNNYFPYTPENVDLESLINETIDLFASHLSVKKIKVTKKISPKHIVYADKNSLMTIFRNLLSNAIKFTPESKLITINSEKLDDRVMISFIDEGVGIPENKIDGLFEIQEGKSTVGTKGEKGVGLGLNLVYEFVELNNGKIEVESVDGEGTTFKVSFPMGE